MQQVEYIGAVVMTRARALACAAALKVDGSHFLDDRESHEGLSRDDLRYIMPYFMPTAIGKPLSGLWHRMCGSVKYGSREYLDPSCWARITEFGLLIGSVRGEVEAACHIIEYLISESDRATLWWSDLYDPAYWGTIYLSAEGRKSIVSDDLQYMEGACGQARMQVQLLDDRRALLDSLLSMGPKVPACEEQRCASNYLV